MQTSRLTSMRGGCCLVELVRFLLDEESEKTRFRRMEDDPAAEEGTEMVSPLVRQPKPSSDGGDRTPPLPGTLRERAAHSCVISFSDDAECELAKPLPGRSIEFVSLATVAVDVDFVLLTKQGPRQTVCNFAGKSAATVNKMLRESACGTSFRVRFQDETFVVIFRHDERVSPEDIQIQAYVCSSLVVRMRAEPTGPEIEEVAEEHRERPAKEQEAVRSESFSSCRVKAVLFWFQHEDRRFAVVAREGPNDSGFLYSDPEISDLRTD